ncbi:cation channel sperm-associated auxiliary subunit epsilon-like [Oculina patagonica]
MDPRHVSEAEKNRTAQFPSQYSKELSGVFFRLGQKPFITGKLGYRFINWDEFQIYNQSFSVIQGCWQFSIDIVINHQLTVWIDGQSIALHDRFIRRSSVQLLKTKLLLSEGNNPKQAEVILTGSNQHKWPFIVQDPCAPHVAIFISSKCLFTQDNFATTVELKVPSSLVLQSEAVVKSAVFSAENLVLLLESGRVLVFNGTTDTWSNPSGLSLVRLSGLASQKKCYEGAHNKIMMTVVLGWSNQSDGNRIYLSKDSGVSFQQLYFPSLSFTVETVEHVDIHCFFPIATFLLNATNENHWKYNFVEDTWMEDELKLLSFNHDPPLSFSFIPPSTQFVIVWSKKSLTFGRLNESGSVLKVKRLDNLTNFMLDDSETIVSVITGGHGDFVVHLSNNRLFHGRAFVEHVVEVFTGEEPSSSLTMMFDMFGSLLLIAHEGENVKTRKLPLENEVLNAVYPHTSCPYFKFTTNISPELHFIDKGDEIKVWALLVYPRAVPNAIRLEISSIDVLQITSEEHVKHYPGVVTLNKTFAFKYNLRNGIFLPKSSYKSTAVAVQLFPNDGELTCENTFQVLHVYVGCPPLKSIVIRNCTAQAGEGPVPLLSEVRSGGEQRPCRLSGSTSASFKLVVDLYEGDKFVQEVHTDYVVWEETGRTDFGYTATMRDAKCLSEAQTWRNLAGNNSGDLSNIWTQNNYQSCFESANNGKAFDGSQPYEILNSTGVSQLVFQGSGTFHFQLRVVGTHLSFCELTTRFSVDVTGSEAKNYLPQLMSVLVVTLSSTVLLYISFAQYTKKTLNRHLEDEEEQQRLQELKSLFSSFQQGTDDAGLSHRRSTSTGHNVRRFTGTAMLMTNRLPEECLADAPGTILATVESPGPSRTSLRSRKSSHTSSN